jgi:hypothetical protein
MAWWQKPESDRSDDEKRQAQRAYLHAFFGDPEGRRVLFDMQRHVHEVGDNSAETQLILQEFVDSIAFQAGVRDMMAVIDAQANIARRFVQPAGAAGGVEQDYTE